MQQLRNPFLDGGAGGGLERVCKVGGLDTGSGRLRCVFDDEGRVADFCEEHVVERYGPRLCGACDQRKYTCAASKT
jgi:hypothetical protein